MKIFIIGAGISGLASALALAHELPDAEITVFERHEILSTSGGAINLTPVAQRHLARLGVLEELGKMGGAGGIEVSAIELFSLHSGRGLGKISFTDAQGEAIGGFKGRRVMRIVLSVAMLAVAERHAQISVVFGKKLVDVEHDDEKDEKKAGGVTARFDDGTAATADLLLGCDGVHSSVRRFVDPACVSEYTGISFIQTTIAAETMTRARKHFHTSAMHVSRHGSLLTSFCDAERETLFVAAIVQMDEHSIASLRLEPLQDGRTQQAIKSAIRQGVVDRFGRSAIPWVRELVAQDADWMVYPVYQVEPGSRWCSNRIVLLGDAAHAVSRI
ncbi:hypothetical protein ASPZODRAFT_136941 [Penicilliopsis zonata CBS 506.65]|uniref:FAD-binding domain-containing protein n=1 Tax=Penicilliopsis zonata CBS 506.65 TaxID=1073090 RepID=A0A1L9S6R4_9EURO|nr:hypothetical protein ASPZODRAFT_136941 [Penicilliopsis zonata CBS 506.65]OJJ42815.1 hypothetical protein ASPZODRAFT_136941 [Penicilliopsis zonata CBS 506.65]